MGLVEDYLETVFEETQMFAIYPPQVHVTLGAIGRVKRGRFVPEGNLSGLQNPIPFEGVTSPGTMSREFKTRDVRRVSLGVGAKVDAGVVLVKPQLQLEFGSDFSVYFAVAGCRHLRIRDSLKLGVELIRRHNLPKSHVDYWDPDLKVVTAVWESSNTTLVISRERNTKMVLEAVGQVEKIDLADASLALSVVFDNTTSDQWITEKGGAQKLTPFCQLHEVDPDWPSADDWELVEPAAPVGEPAFVPHAPTARGRSLNGWRLDR